MGSACAKPDSFLSTTSSLKSTMDNLDQVAALCSPPSSCDTGTVVARLQAMEAACPHVDDDPPTCGADCVAMLTHFLDDCADTMRILALGSTIDTLSAAATQCSGR